MKNTLFLLLGTLLVACISSPKNIDEYFNPIVIKDNFAIVKFIIEDKTLDVNIYSIDGNKNLKDSKTYNDDVFYLEPGTHTIAVQSQNSSVITFDSNSYTSTAGITLIALTTDVVAGKSYNLILKTVIVDKTKETKLELVLQ